MQTLGAIELGGTWLRMATGRADGQLVHRARLPLPDPAVLAQVVADWMHERGPIARLGVACFGPIRLDRGAPDWGAILPTPKPGWAGFPLGQRLRDALQVPVLIETDVGAAALAEHRLGAGQGCGTMAYLTVGTGIGVGIRVDAAGLHGRLHPELGHMRIARDAGDTFRGTCPFHGDCWEGLASGPALLSRARRSVGPLPPEHPAWSTEAGLLARGVHVLLSGLALERVVLGGGVGTAPGLLARVRAALGAIDGGYTPGLDPEVDLVAPALGHDSGLVGALLLAGERVSQAIPGAAGRPHR
jgi:fructokinase